MSLNTNSLSLGSATSDWARAANNAAYAPSSYTIEAWINGTDFSGAPVIMAKDAAALRQFVLTVNAGSLSLEHYDTSGNGYFVRASTNIISTNTYTHVAVVNNAGAFSMYINGSTTTIGTSGAAYAAMALKTNDLTVGRRDFSGAEQYFNGLIDESRFWSTALSQGSIQARMSIQLAGTETGLIGYWQWNTGSGTTEVDLSSTNNSMNLKNSATWSTTVPFTNAPVTAIMTPHSKFWGAA